MALRGVLRLWHGGKTFITNCSKIIWDSAFLCPSRRTYAMCFAFYRRKLVFDFHSGKFILKRMFKPIWYLCVSMSMRDKLLCCFHQIYSNFHLFELKAKLLLLFTKLPSKVNHIPWNVPLFAGVHIFVASDYQQTLLQHFPIHMVNVRAENQERKKKTQEIRRKNEGTWYHLCVGRGRKKTHKKLHTVCHTHEYICDTFVNDKEVDFLWSVD